MNNIHPTFLLKDSVVIENNILKKLLNQYICDSSNPEINFSMGIYYHSIGQTAAAISYYIRTAERTDDTLLKYESLIRAAMCFNTQGCRNFSVKGMLQNAIVTLPKRPEAYFLLSRLHEQNKEWQDCYLIASIGESLSEIDNKKLRTVVDYPGKYGIIFEKAVSAWWVGLCEESRNLFRYLSIHEPLNSIYKTAVINNLKNLNAWKSDNQFTYTKDQEFENQKKRFDWGLIEKNSWFHEVVKKEIFDDDIYQKFFEVNENDIVCDFGASVGPFTYKILDKNPKKIYCFEPHEDLYKTLVENVSSDRVVCINKAIGSTNDFYTTQGLFNEKIIETSNNQNTKTVPSIKFSTFVKENNITQIDFLKSDCEGGEYEIFNNENFNWIINNVKKISGEWHLVTQEQKNLFRKFRDTYLRNLPNHEIFSIDNVDIKWSLWDDWFINHYSLITLYIDNRKEKDTEYKLLKWKSTDYPTLEITTSVPRNGCVVDCLFCPQKTLQEKYHGERFLSLDNFKKILDKIPIEIRIAFSGFTEPWMNKECTDMILYAHERGHSISVFTTGVGMKISDLERIKHIPFSDGPNGGFVFHLPDNELFAKHPITDKYVELIEYLGTLRNNIKNFYIMTMGTVHESVKHVFDGIPRSEMWSRAGNLIHESVLNPELLNFKDNFKTIYHGEQNMTCNCMEGLYHNVLLPNGDVSLCCMDYGLDHILGNLFTQTYNEVIPLPMSCFNLCRFCENGTKSQ